MRLKEAQALIGTRVSAWTAMNGTYVGILQSVEGSPWRGRVRITGILTPASHLQHGQVCRRGFRVGEELDVGGSNIKPTTAEGSLSYLEVLQRAIAENRSRPVPSTSPHAWVHEAFAKAMEVVARAEKKRLETGEWELRATLEGTRAAPCS
jgi:hypothetical protein